MKLIWSHIIFTRGRRDLWQRGCEYGPRCRFDLIDDIQLLDNLFYKATVDCQNDSGIWTDIRVYTLEMKAHTEMLDFTCCFCAAKELKKQIESYVKASEKFEITHSLDKIKGTNQ